MTNHSRGWGTVLFLLGPALTLGAVATIGLWLGLFEDGRLGLPAALALALLTVAGTVWRWRSLADRRLRDTLDAYAEKEIARAERPRRGWHGPHARGEQLRPSAAAWRPSPRKEGARR
jgi:hypothetical protein